MATGEHQDGHPALRDGHQQDLPPGEVVVGSGRVSAARRVTPVLSALPFSRSQLGGIDDALALANRSAGLNFSVYLGDLGDETRARAEELLDSLGAQDGATAVLVAVSPGQRVVEIVTGAQARHRLTDRGCKLGVMSMVAAFEQGDLAEGLISGLRMLAEQADSSVS